MTKIKNTRIVKLPIGKDYREVLVTDAVLVLMECRPEEALFYRQKGNIYDGQLNRYYPKYGLVKGIGKYLKPILISLTEKIEVLDKIYNKEFNEIDFCAEGSILAQSNNNCDHLWFKILAMPEHFSEVFLLEITNQIMNGVLIECEGTINNDVGTESYRQTDGYHIKHTSSNHVIKINLSKIKGEEVNVVPFSLLVEAFNAGVKSVEPIIKYERYGDMEAYPSTELKYGFDEWYTELKQPTDGTI